MKTKEILIGSVRVSQRGWSVVDGHGAVEREKDL